MGVTESPISDPEYSGTVTNERSNHLDDRQH